MFIIKVKVSDNGRLSKRYSQYQETIQASALRQIEGFDPIIDETLKPGDILYPPGFPHEGTTLEPSMSYSVVTVHQRTGANQQLCRFCTGA